MAQPPLTEKGLVYEASLGQLRTSFTILSAIHATATLFHVAAPKAESALLETQGRMWLCSSSGSARVQHPAPLQSLREPFPPPVDIFGEPRPSIVLPSLVLYSNIICIILRI